MSEEILRFLSLRDANVQFVLLGSLLLGAAGGLLGAFALLRKRSLLGDALAHAALPGVAIAFLITGTRTIFPLLIGAMISGILGVLLIQWIIRASRIKADAAIGLVLSVFFGVGIVLLTHIQRQPVGNQSGLDKFLFGQAASIIQSDLWVMAIISMILLITVLLFFKEFKLLCFDPDFMTSLGVRASILDLLLMALIVFAVMVGLQAVGVILMAAMLITPAAAARFWSHDLKRMVIISALFGGISGILGTFISALAPRIPTGPVMVLAATGFFIVSALAAPRNGLIARWLRHLHNSQTAEIEHLLRAIIELKESGQHVNGIPIEQIARHLQQTRRQVNRLVHRLGRKRMAVRQNGQLRLTEKGERRALQIVRTHRLWEYYLVYRARLQPDHVHRDADEMEHILPEEVLHSLENLLQSEGVNVEKVISVH